MRKMQGLQWLSSKELRFAIVGHTRAPAGCDVGAVDRADMVGRVLHDEARGHCCYCCRRRWQGWAGWCRIVYEIRFLTCRRMDGNELKMLQTHAWTSRRKMMAA